MHKNRCHRYPFSREQLSKKTNCPNEIEREAIITRYLLQFLLEQLAKQPESRTGSASFLLRNSPVVIWQGIQFSATL